MARARYAAGRSSQVTGGDALAVSLAMTCGMAPLEVLSLVTSSQRVPGGCGGDDLHVHHHRWGAAIAERMLPMAKRRRSLVKHPVPFGKGWSQAIGDDRAGHTCHDRPDTLAMRPIGTHVIAPQPHDEQLVRPGMVSREAVHHGRLSAFGPLE